MKIVSSTQKLCLSCMKMHCVQNVLVTEETVYKKEPVYFGALYEYCVNSDEFTETEDMLKINDLSMKDAYRNKMNLLTSSEIVKIREKYGVSQKDFSDILGWGKATITRYENHQVQDIAHDDIMRKLDSDPKWFLFLLNRAKHILSEKSYKKYSERTKSLFNNTRNDYLIDSIYANYARLDNDASITGSTELNIDKVIEAINYLATKVENLNKVKLAKMLWYSDNLHYKRFGSSITGLAYRALPFGAVPEGFEQIVLLEGIIYDELLYGENIAYKFKPVEGFKVNILSDDETEVIDEIINSFGALNTDEIVATMHGEVAYTSTFKNRMIRYDYTNSNFIQ